MLHARATDAACVMRDGSSVSKGQLIHAAQDVSEQEQMTTCVQRATAQHRTW